MDRRILAVIRPYPIVSGRHARRGMRQSIPSNSIANCANDIDTLPSFATG
jgi:hypothetical protein